jgi:hypothetical protein
MARPVAWRRAACSVSVHAVRLFAVYEASKLRIMDEIALQLTYSVDADVSPAFAWRFRTDVTKWHDPPLGGMIWLGFPHHRHMGRFGVAKIVNTNPLQEYDCR